jgi:hypothetical protein
MSHLVMTMSQAFVGGNDEHDEIKAVRSGEHVFHEAFVAGYIYESKVRIANGEIGKTNINGDAAFLLFFQAVGVDARQSSDERGLAVVNVAGGADDDAFHETRSLLSQATRATSRSTFWV